MKHLLMLSRLLVALCLPVLLLSSNIRWTAGSPALYRYGFERYGVAEASGIDAADLARVTEGLPEYFSSDEDYWRITVIRYGQQTQLLSDREAEHFRDVKALIRLDRWLQVATLAYVVAFVIGVLLWKRRDGWRQVAGALRWGSAVTLGLMALLGLAMLAGFERVFLGFHLAFFSNDLWLAQPGDIMTTLFPGGFFRDAAAFVAVATVLEALVLGGGSWLALRAMSRRWSS
ncbi:MAG: DUF1461 domain-containing protein [Chloroflexota bacterium]